MNQTLPTHDFSICEGEMPLFEIFIYTPLTVMTPVLRANFEPHRHTFYELMYLTGGEGEHVIDFTPHRHEPPCLYFLSPGQVHFWDITRPIEGYVILFKEDFLVSSMLNSGERELTFFSDMLDSPGFTLNSEQQGLLDPLLSAMVDEFNNQNIGRRSVLQAYFHIFLVKILRICVPAPENTFRISLFRKFKKLIAQNISCDTDIHLCAKELGMSTTNLRNSIKKETGKSPTHFIRQQVILEAKRMLIHTDQSSAEIAYSLGFEDPSYFGRYFKRETGLSPRTFKQQINKKYHLKVV